MRIKEKSNFASAKEQLFIGGLLFIGLVLLNSGCVPVTGVGVRGGDGVDVLLERFIVTEPQFNIKIAEQNGLLPSDNFWFAGGDSATEKTVTYGWNAAVIQYRGVNSPESCSFAPAGSGCYQCDQCAVQRGEVCNNGVSNFFVAGSSPLAVLLKTESANPAAEQVVRNFGAMHDGCLMRPANASVPFPTFVPEQDAVFKLRTLNSLGQYNNLVNFNATVVKTPRTFRVKPEPYRDEADPSTLRYRFQMPLTNGRLQTNFSPNLRVSKVRVLDGMTDPATGREGVFEDAATLYRIRPSRILFLPDFQEGNVNNSPSEGSNRCYFDPTKDDGGFDLLNSCRRNAPNAGNPVFSHPHHATPTFLDANGRRADTLTWVIEYKLSDGLPNPANFLTEEFPVLEFTIEEAQ